MRTKFYFKFFLQKFNVIIVIRLVNDAIYLHKKEMDDGEKLSRALTNEVAFTHWPPKEWHNQISF